MEDHWRPTDAHQVQEADITPLPDTDYDERLDQLLISLDHMLMVIHATASYFDANPDASGFVVQMSVDEACRGDAEAAQFIVTRDTVRQLNYMALSRYMTIREFGALPTELANDVVKSWMEPTGDHDSIFIFDERGAAPERGAA